MPEPAKSPFILIYQELLEHFGPLNWWPADSPFEVVIGAILTQNTAWTNVEKAITNLKKAEAISIHNMAKIPLHQLEELIRPSGFFRQKASRLQSFSTHLATEWQSSLSAFCSGPLDETRKRLLARPGIGPETADSILLYAADRPTFVIDAYTKRIFERVGMMQALPENVALYNEYHAQIVQLAKTCCRKRKPLCKECPLYKRCHFPARATAVETNGSSAVKAP
jgi:endonuclease-3 related protein